MTLEISDIYLFQSSTLDFLDTELCITEVQRVKLVTHLII